MEYDVFVSIGANCRVTEALRDSELRLGAFPLDWTLNSAQCVLSLYQSGFNNFFDESACIPTTYSWETNRSFTYVLNTEHFLNITHETSWTVERENTYEKRVQSLKEHMNQERVLLIRWDMKSPFHNDPIHANHEICDAEFYEAKDSLDKLYELADFCNNTYEGQTDLLIIHADEILESKKRDGVFYYKISMDRPDNIESHITWDHYQIKFALQKMKARLRAL